MVGGDKHMTGKLYSICATLAIACAVPSLARERFDSAEAAAKAIIDAADNRDFTRLSALLGPQATRILTSGDSAQDSAEQAEFTRLAHSKHRLEISSMHHNRAILAIGEEDWPFSPYCPRQGQVEL